MTIEVPEYTQRMKALVSEVSELFVKRNAITKRIRDGSLYFKREISPQDASRGLVTISNLLSEMEATDLEIRDKFTEFTIIAEEQFAGLEFSFHLPQSQDASGEVLPPRVIDFKPTWDGKTSTITPEEIWFFQIAKKLFGVSGADIKLKVK